MNIRVGQTMLFLLDADEEKSVQLDMALLDYLYLQKYWLDLSLACSKPINHIICRRRNAWLEPVIGPTIRADLLHWRQSSSPGSSEVSLR